MGAGITRLEQAIAAIELKSYGQWMQFSGFECTLMLAEYNRLHNRLNKPIKLEKDSIRFCFFMRLLSA